MEGGAADLYWLSSEQSVSPCVALNFITSFPAELFKIYICTIAYNNVQTVVTSHFKLFYSYSQLFQFQVIIR